MKIAQFDRWLAQQPALQQDSVLPLARASVDIRVTARLPLDHESRFGGHPLVPEDFAWPQHAQGDYYFLGQINFGEIVEAPPILPKSGLLSLFYALDADGEVFWGDEGYIVGYYWPTSAGLVLMPQPDNDALRAGGIVLRFQSRKIELQTGVDLPRHEDLDVAWPAGKEDMLAALAGLELAEDYLLGYPSYTRLAYDPTPGPAWLPLLTVTSHDTFDWCWHDGDKLMVFIERERLAACDFSRLQADAG